MEEKHQQLLKQYKIQISTFEEQHLEENKELKKNYNDEISLLKENTIHN